MNTCDAFKTFWTSRMVLNYCNIPIYKYANTLILYISAPVLTYPVAAYYLILPKNKPPVLSMATTHTCNHCCEVVDIGHTNNRIIQQNTESGKPSLDFVT